MEEISFQWGVSSSTFLQQNAWRMSPVLGAFVWALAEKEAMWKGHTGSGDKVPGGDKELRPKHRLVHVPCRVIYI